MVTAATSTTAATTTMTMTTNDATAAAVTAAVTTNTTITITTARTVTIDHYFRCYDDYHYPDDFCVTIFAAVTITTIAATNNSCQVPGSYLLCQILSDL